MGLVMPGCRMFHASASWPGVQPLSSAMDVNSSTTAKRLVGEETALALGLDAAFIA